MKAPRDTLIHTIIHTIARQTILWHGFGTKRTGLCLGYACSGAIFPVPRCAKWMPGPGSGAASISPFTLLYEIPASWVTRVIALRRPATPARYQAAAPGSAGHIVGILVGILVGIWARDWLRLASLYASMRQGLRMPEASGLQSGSHTQSRPGSVETPARATTTRRHPSRLHGG